MSIDRKDLRVYFDPAVHAALLELANVDRLEPARLVEAVVQQYVVDRCHVAMMIANRVDVAGLNRLRPVSTGCARIEPDHAGDAPASVSRPRA